MEPDLARIEASFISKYRIARYYSDAECPATLVASLCSLAPHVDPAEWPRRLAWGGVYVNGLPAAADTQLLAPCKVEYYEPKFDIERAQEFFPAFKTEYIIFEDEDLLVSFKPAGLPCHPAKEQTHFNLRSAIESYLGRKVHMPSRLDMSTQGIVLVSKSPRMHGKCQKLFSERRIDKTYLFETDRRADWREYDLSAPIGRDPRHSVLRRVIDSGREARTRFRLAADSGDRFVFIAKPLTGRTHQIRVHAAYLGLPINGDKFYGGSEAQGLRLLSFGLGFLHPFTGRALELTLPEALRPDWVPTALKDAAFSFGDPPKID